MEDEIAEVRASMRTAVLGEWGPAPKDQTIRLAIKGYPKLIWVLFRVGGVWRALYCKAVDRDIL